MRKNQNRREAMSFLTAGILFLMVLKLFTSSDINRETVDVITLLPGVSISFFFDHLSYLVLPRPCQHSSRHPQL